MDSDATPTRASGSFRGVADLARAGGEGASSPFARVIFEIHHHLDGPGIYRDLLTREQDGPLGEFDYGETLTFAANGIGLIIGTTLERDAAGSGLGEAPASAIHLVSEVHRESRNFGGESQPNPSFLYEAADVLEGIVSIEPEPVALGARHTYAAKYLALEIARVAALDAGAPLLYLQFPVQAPSHHYTGDGSSGERSDDWPRSSAMYLRFGIAMSGAKSHDRFFVLRTLANYCEELGYGFWTSDSRPGRRSGNWFQIRHHDLESARDVLRKKYAKRSGWNSTWTLPVTIMGPARVGSTQATMELLAKVPGIGISGLCVTSLDELAFIHLQLHLPLDTGAEYKRAALAFETLPFPLDDRAFDALVTVFDSVGVSLSDVDDQTVARFVDRTAGYNVLAGPVVQRQPDHKHDRRPVWVSWEMESGSRGLRVPLLALYSAIDKLLEAEGVQRQEKADDGEPLYPNIEYLISRDVGGGTYRAKGKLAVPQSLLARLFENVDSTDVPVRLVIALEEGWLAGLNNTERGPRELAVAWRENWLGRWSSLVG